MSLPYNSIPPEREAAYLQNAQKSFEEAATPVIEPVVQELGHLVVEEAQDILKLDPRVAGTDFAPNLAEKASQYDALATTTKIMPSDRESAIDINGAAFSDFMEALKKRQRPTLQDQVWDKAKAREQDPRFDTDQ